MKSPILFFTILLLTSCQSQYDPTEEVTVKMASATLPLNTIDTQNLEDGWYSELNEISGFENYEEENGILLGKNLSLGTYVNLKNRKEKLLILEEIKHQKNGEALFRKLDSKKIVLKKISLSQLTFVNPKKSMVKSSLFMKEEMKINLQKI